MTRLVAMAAPLLLALPAQATELQPLGSAADLAGGKLAFFSLSPERPKSPTPVVVLMHGCQQRGDSYAERSGWKQLAERSGFALVVADYRLKALPGFPSNCLPWFAPDQEPALTDAAAKAVDALRATLGPGPNYVTGLSAGGAATAILMARKPELWSGGGIVAGLAYGCTHQEDKLYPVGFATCGANMACRAWRCMATGLPEIKPERWEKQVRDLGATPKSWPKLAIIQGDADDKVTPQNALDLKAQWSALAGPDAVKLEMVPALPHAQPVTEGCGQEVAGDFFKRSSVCAAEEFARFWGIE
jgi:poly(hydroxyalkanoate) depolymerase family esterase